VAEAVCHSYNLRLVRYLSAAWEWLQPEDLAVAQRPPVHTVGDGASTEERCCSASGGNAGPGLGS
jgi:hypothetical protein